MCITKNYSINLIRNKYIIFIFFSLLMIYGCNKNKKVSSDSKIQSILSLPETNDEFFQEIGQEIGIDFVHSIGADHMENIVESVGGGAAFLDFDQDGFIDIYTCSGTWVEGFSKNKKPEKITWEPPLPKFTGWYL